MVTQNAIYGKYGGSHQCACYRQLVLPPIEKSMEPCMKNKEIKDLQQLLGYIKLTVSQKQLPSIKQEKKNGSLECSQWPSPPQRSGGQTLSAEDTALQQFSSKYHAVRNFSQHIHHAKFLEVFSALIEYRLCNSDWMMSAAPESILRMLMCLRILMRDSAYQKHFFAQGGVKQLSEYFNKATDSYLYYGDTPCMVDILKEMTNIFQKLSSVIEQQEWLIACGAHTSLVLLLSSNDVIVLHCSLLALICLAQSPQPRLKIGDLNCVEQLLRIIQEYDNVSKKHATRLLCLLCQDMHTRDEIKLHDGVPILLSQLVSDNANMLCQVVWCIATLCVDQEISKDVRQVGGIPLLLSLLHERTFVSERNEASGCASASIHSRTLTQDDVFDFSAQTNKAPKTKAEEFMETQYKLKQACCGALAELVLNDTNAQQIAQTNGIYTIGLLILPSCSDCGSRERKAAQLLQRFAFRTLRFLFSMERNRRLFKKLFPAELYTMFIDIGHYNRELSAYKPLVQHINSLNMDVIDSIRENMMEMNQNRTPTHYIKDYAVFEHLGRGAFGSVYKVRKKVGQTFVALKEIDLMNPAFGKSVDRDKSVGDMINELQIMRAGIRHPNIVRYHKTFLEGNTLFIIMDLIEGAPLNEHFNSLKEKRDTFSESRIWNILIQMILALRYLHKDKGIVHRDLTPNNIMLGENDKVTITDFGLAKVKGTDTSKMTSVCGTILYSCPEMVEGHPYGEKADIWALGCILYQMCVLDPPFFNTNMLTLVKNIVEGKYKPVPDGLYSQRLVDTIKSCICPSADKRPDAVQLAGEMSDMILRHMDSLQTSQLTLERKLDRERKRTQKHFEEANRNMQKYHKICHITQERYEKLANLGGSGGASGFKDGNMNDSAYDSQISPLVNSPEDTEPGGWSSDDDSCPSSEYESQSRESSAGSTRSGSHGLRRNKTMSQLPPVPTPRNRDNYSQQLTVDIPNSSKISRDSGFGSGDPSPVQGYSPSLSNGEHHKEFFRSNSSPAPKGQTKKSKTSKRPKSANTSTLTISNRRVRQISDPITQMLHTLHKIIYISQLPPTLDPNPRRRVIERFKRALFGPQSSSFNLKGELHKLNTGSREIIDLNFGPIGERLNSAGSDLSLGSKSRRGSSSSLSSADGGQINTSQRNTKSTRERADSLRRRQNSSDRQRVSSAGSDSDSSMSSTLKATTPRTLTLDLCVTHLDHDDSITYEQLQSMIETVLVECGYYSVSPQGREKTPPQGSFISESVRSRLMASSHLT
ncbi:serine/threonine-protein kinase Nek10-like isoform X1 [Ruditapes philippinarum]|uniref:serine/threonine-protein kinase Nek10-like isoform X1 n=1 Tax=Ruditapes philippinarum TaxID=129788 RepID=UPI00295BDFE8|nr:serine/threonine-protein kinase Nek10-like isoform X1 [Ruditapes philippinarum]